MTWGDVKKGDRVLVVHINEFDSVVRAKRTDVVKSIGRSYITVSCGDRFDVDTGYGSFGAHLHTESTLDAHLRRRTAERRIHRGINRWVANASLEELESFASKMVVDQ